MQIVRREGLAALLQLPAGWPDRLFKQAHMRIAGRASAFFHIARRAGCNDVLPSRLATHSARNDMVERQMMTAAAILALKAIAQKQVEARESGKLAWLHILPECNNAGDFHIQRRRMHFAVIAGDNVHAVQKHRFYRGLPRPQAKPIVRQRRIIRIKYQSRARFRIARRILFRAAESRCSFNQFGFEHGLFVPPSSDECEHGVPES